MGGLLGVPYYLSIGVPNIFVRQGYLGRKKNRLLAVGGERLEAGLQLIARLLHARGSERDPAPRQQPTGNRNSAHRFHL